jgi:hypothetical protein
MTVVQNINKTALFFSDHGSEQLHTRSQMKRSEVLRLFTNKLYIPVGVDKHRVHTVIYSEKDDIPLVIVHDERNGEVVTVLYLEYNNKFVIDPNIAANIKKMTLNKLEKPKQTIADQTSWLDLYSQVRQCPEVKGLVRLYFHVKTGDGFKDVEFLTLNSDDFGGDVARICDIPHIKIKIENGRVRKQVAKLAIVNIFTILDTGRKVKLGASREYELMVQAQLNKAQQAQQKKQKVNK